MYVNLRNFVPAVFLSAGIATLSAASVTAATVDLSTFSDENFGSEVWQVDSSGTSVTHISNGGAGVFFSGTNDLGSYINSVNVSVNNHDDDYIGFVFGFNSGDLSNLSANYLLLDWRKGDQSFDFNGDSNATNAVAGLALSRVTGAPTIDELWGHVNYSGDAGGGVQELIRATNLGNTGWEVNKSVNFDFVWTADELQVVVDGILEIAIETPSSAGSFGFYDFSQAQATFSSYTTTAVREYSAGATPAEAVPEPASWVFLAVGLVGFGFARCRSLRLLS